MQTLYLFDNFDEPKGALHLTSALVHTEQVKGDDQISFMTNIEPDKCDRILWHDEQDGCWREFVVKTVKKELGGLFEVVAESSLFELRCDYVENVVLKSAIVREALAASLSTTRWQVDPLSQAGGAVTVWFYHQSVLACLREIEEKWGCELYTRIDVEDRRITGRYVGVKRSLGKNRGARFTCAKNITKCSKTVLEDDVYTALYGWGAGSIVMDDDGYWTGGYTNRVGFADVNNGVPWVGSESARQAYGIWNADHTEKVHRFGEVVFKDIEDPRLLYSKTLQQLAYYTTPAIAYEVDVRLFDGGVPVFLGDTVAVIDTSHEPEWRFTARVLKRTRVFGNTLQTTVELETLKQLTNDKSSGQLIARAADVVTDPETEGATEAEIIHTAVQEYLAQFDLGDEEF